MCSFHVLRLLPPGSEFSLRGNIDSRVTDRVDLHIYTYCQYASFLYLCVCGSLVAFVLSIHS